MPAMAEAEILTQGPVEQKTVRVMIDGRISVCRCQQHQNRICGLQSAIADDAAFRDKAPGVLYRWIVTCCLGNQLGDKRRGSADRFKQLRLLLQGHQCIADQAGRASLV